MWPRAVVPGEADVRTTTGSSSPAAWALFISAMKLCSIIPQKKPKVTHTRINISQPSEKSQFCPNEAGEQWASRSQVCNYPTLDTRSCSSRPPAKTRRVLEVAEQLFTDRRALPWALEWDETRDDVRTPPPHPPPPSSPILLLLFQLQFMLRSERAADGDQLGFCSLWTRRAAESDLKGPRAASRLPLSS